MTIRALVFCCATFLACATPVMTAHAAEGQTVTDAPTASAAPAARSLILQDPNAGYSLSLPAGWQTLSKEDVAKVVEGNPLVPPAKKPLVTSVSTGGAQDTGTASTRAVVAVLPIAYADTILTAAEAEELCKNPEPPMEGLLQTLANLPEAVQGSKILRKERNKESVLICYSFPETSEHLALATQCMLLRPTKTRFMVVAAQLRGPEDPARLDAVVNAMRGMQVRPDLLLDIAN